MGYNNFKNIFSHFKDKSFRKYQEDVIGFIENSTKPICVVQAPTGFGKSLASMCAGAVYQNFTYLVSSKQLQSQLCDDFPEVPMMKGRNNYKCTRNEDNNADECTHTKKSPCLYKRTKCEYEVEKRRVLASPYRLLNYHYFLYEVNHIGRFSDPPSKLIICDEGDLLEGLLASFISLMIPGSLITKLNIPSPEYKTASSELSIPAWKAWGEDLISECTIELNNVEENLERSNPRDPEFGKLHKAKRLLESTIFSARTFVRTVDHTWIFEEKKPIRLYQAPTYIFRPTWITEELSEQFFFRHGEKFVLTSATFPPHTVLGKLLGRSPGDFDYFTVPGVFPPKNRPVYLKCVGNLTQKTWADEVDKIVDEIGRLLAKHIDEKGIIHAVSYKLAKYIMEQIPVDRLITHNNKDREIVLEKFKDAKERLVLVSPSIERGVDMPDDFCRFIIWSKAPFMSLGDKLTNQRVYGSKAVGSLWYRSLCAQTIVQGCGRGVRHKDDYCKTYILDEQIKKLILHERSLFPSYFMEAVEL